MSTQFVLSTHEINEIENQKKYYENYKAVAIEALKIVQKQRGWVSDLAIIEIAKILNINSSDIESVATFYSQIYRQPVGRNIIRYCDSVVCYLTGYQKIKKALENHLSIKTGCTTVDKRFTLLPICCLGNCDKSPTIMINEDLYSKLTPESVLNLLESYK
ncbi:NADH-quinone oxidoreductase subunit NuoE [Buchnera aphidicola]|uniref:NADH-quinone oxidoreductase subunit E n=1 Tax=Buchnera aphidicola (Aphis gossypii) TaxID=98785 RepID=A0A5J6ZD72_9GAMM|nr:NADH-quinone oxidoreductase subunit NuoE [Buchnera aphidicola]QFQ32003.1 NADH-quinone oxidoreductase subunit NuoE [Buchnera aphidicola (Aphis gossypii)]UPT14901.1 NADH-quinone oxidoreductase subunit NuoE [Buchnera aphidicola (Aphis gossypii)]